MSALNRKVLRDLWTMRGQVSAIALVMACGIATFVMSLNTLNSLRKTQDAYYERYRFADVFAHLRRAPSSLTARLAEIPGIATVEARVVESVTLDVSGFPEPVAGKIISIPQWAEPRLNGIHLRRGRLLEPQNDGEILISEAFADAHSLNPGDSVRAVLNGRFRQLRIVGIALSPEFIYQIREGDLLPDDRRFGVIWMSELQVEAVFDMKGSFNDVVFQLAPGASEADVIRRVDRLLAPYGCLGAFGREDQSSHKFVTNELRELRGMALVTPTIFLSVAAFLLNIVMSRLVTTQRDQIATLKAFGYSKFEVGVQYVKFVLVIAVGGTAAGTLVGAELGRSVAHLYSRFFHFPIFEFEVEAGVVALAFLINGGAAIAGTLAAVLRAARLPPADAMRPEQPSSYRPALLERLGLQVLFSPAIRMMLRHLERQPLRTTLSVVGVAVAVAVLVLGNFTVDSLNYVMETQFEVAQRQELSVSFIEDTTSDVTSDLTHLPGVRFVEPFRALPIRASSKHHSRRLALIGLPDEQRLFRVLDVAGRQTEIGAAGGIVVSSKLAEALEVGLGDSITVEVLKESRPVVNLPIVAMVDDFSGISAYASIGTTWRIMQDETISGSYLAADDARLDALYSALKRSPRVASVTVKRAALESFRQTVAENLLRMRLFNVFFACAIAFGVVYNAARIALSERSRELATLRVIGFRRSEISLILLGELAIITAVAIPLGLLLGYGLAAFVIEVGFDTELFRIPLVISRQTYGFAAIVTGLAAIVSGLIVRRRLDRLDLVSVLKSRE